MAKEFDPTHLDVDAFARSGAALGGSEPLQRYARLLEDAQESGAQLPVHWRAVGAVRSGVGVLAAAGLNLHVEATLPMTCQRCLERVDVPLAFDRAFRFAQDEETAAALDSEADEDVLAISTDFDLHTLIEDELLLAAPLVPVHDSCPVPVRLQAADPDFDAAAQEKPKPFAALAALKGGKPPG